MEEFVKPLDEIIKDRFLPALLGTSFTGSERELFTLPISLGGLSVPIYAEKAITEHDTSKKLTAPLAAIMMLQSNELPNDDEVTAIKREIHINKSSIMKTRVSTVEGSLSSDTLRAVRQTQEKGASNWLSVIPLEEHGFVLPVSGRVMWGRAAMVFDVQFPFVLGDTAAPGEPRN